MTYLIYTFLHLDVQLASVVSAYGPLTYAILFFILFCETGLVVTPFLPGDSMIFAAGALAALGALNPVVLFLVMSIAVILGDTVNYWIGYHAGEKLFARPRGWFLNIEHLHRAEAFYARHGGKTIILARFMPIIRTFAPFVAGMSRMDYRRFFFFNMVGGIVWVGLFVAGGYFVGNIPAVKHNFEYVILGIILVSFLPPIYEVVKEKLAKRRAQPIE